MSCGRWGGWDGVGCRRWEVDKREAAEEKQKFRCRAEEQTTDAGTMCQKGAKQLAVCV